MFAQRVGCWWRFPRKRIVEVPERRWCWMFSRVTLSLPRDKWREWAGQWRLERLVVVTVSHEVAPLRRSYEDFSRTATWHLANYACDPLLQTRTLPDTNDRDKINVWQHLSLKKTNLFLYLLQSFISLNLEIMF